jgi:hypothetical protein
VWIDMVPPSAPERATNARYAGTTSTGAPAAHAE